MGLPGEADDPFVAEVFALEQPASSALLQEPQTVDVPEEARRAGDSALVGEVVLQCPRLIAGAFSSTPRSDQVPLER